VLAAGLLLSGCTTRIADFTITSTKNMDLENNPTYKVEPRRVVGEDICHFILGIPTGISNFKTATDRAIEKYPDCVGLSNVVISWRGWSAILYAQGGYIVEGDPIVRVKTTPEAKK
jgi:hypothetical protein